MRTGGESPIEASHSQVFPRIGAATLCSWPRHFPIALPSSSRKEHRRKLLLVQCLSEVRTRSCLRFARGEGDWLGTTRYGRHRTKVETDLLHRCPPVFSAPATDNRALCHCYMRLLAYFPQTSRKRLTGLGHLLDVVERLWSASQPSCAAVPAQVLSSRHLLTLLGINRLLTGPSFGATTSKMASCVELSSRQIDMTAQQLRGSSPPSQPRGEPCTAGLSPATSQLHCH